MERGKYAQYLIRWKERGGAFGASEGEKLEGPGGETLTQQPRQRPGPTLSPRRSFIFLSRSSFLALRMAAWALRSPRTSPLTHFGQIIPCRGAPQLPHDNADRGAASLPRKPDIAAEYEKALSRRMAGSGWEPVRVRRWRRGTGGAAGARNVATMTCRRRRSSIRAVGPPYEAESGGMPFNGTVRYGMCILRLFFVFSSSPSTSSQVGDEGRCPFACSTRTCAHQKAARPRVRGAPTG